MKFRYLKLLLFLFLFILLPGCGKVSLENGEYVTDVSYLDEGCFDIKTIDTSFIPGDYLCEARTINGSNYEYILSYFDNSDFSQSYYYLNFDNYGKVFCSGELDIPISVKEQKVIFSDVCADLDIKPYNLSIKNGSLYYSHFIFSETGDFSAICRLDSMIEGREEGVIYRQYLVNWNKEGKCIGIKNINESDIVYSDFTYIICPNNEENFETNSIGISIVDSDGRYVSNYFNYINSGVYARDFYILSIYDENCFSGIYRDADDHPLLACFNRHQGRNYNKKPILLACTKLDESLKADIIRFNQTNKEYMITVEDYSIRTESGTENEAWIELKKDIINGFSPDIILNTTCYDASFIDRLSSDGKLCELSNVIYKDSNLKGLSFTDNATELFYNKGSIFNVVPYYEYDTVVGNYEAMDLYSGWDLSGYTVFSMSVPDYYYLINENYQDRMVERFLYYNGSAYVNYESHTSEFDSDEMRRLLEYTATLPSESDYYNDYRNNVGAGDYRISEIQCINLSNMHLDATKNSNGRYSDLGFPRSGGGSGVVTTDRCFMISSGHAYTNECWEFVRQYLTKDYQTTDFSGIPVTTNGFDAWKTYKDSSSINPDDYTYTVNGEELFITYPSDNEAQYITDQIQNCRTFAFSDYTVEQIVMDYAHQYFEGKISLDDAVKAIDKDVEAYLSSL